MIWNSCFIGFGVFALKNLECGSLLLEYEGDRYNSDPLLSVETYVYEFRHKGKRIWYVSFPDLISINLIYILYYLKIFCHFDIGLDLSKTLCNGKI